MKDLFHFKEFAVDQRGCAMKVNTDGVLLGALAQTKNPISILDIGTGTGVIALMLAQRFPLSNVDAVEIDLQAAETAKANFLLSSFSSRLIVYPNSFQEYSSQNPDKRYDLIVSNPPFFSNSFKNPDKKKEIARHTTDLLFDELVMFAVNHLNSTGVCSFILPPDAAKKVIKTGLQYNLNLHHIINIRSSLSKLFHRQIIRLGFEQLETQQEDFTIYQDENVYTAQYINTLKNFLTIFED